MSRFNTGNPIDSDDLKDLSDNAKNTDLFSNDMESESYTDRFGRKRKTIHGMALEFSRDQKDRDDRFNEFISSSGYQFVGDYAVGVELTEYNQIVRDENGEFWRVSGQIDLPYVTTGAGVPENDALVPAGDAVLRQDLANPDKGAAIVGFREGVNLRQRIMAEVFVDDFGAKGDGVTDDTSAIQSAFDSKPEGALIKFRGGANYKVSALDLPSNSVIDLAFCTVSKLPSSLSVDHIFRADAACKNVTLKNGFLIGDAGSHLNGSGEGVHNIFIYPGATILVFGVA